MTADARATLLALQNADGGFGIAFGYGSDPLDTALAILALVDRPLVPGAAVDKAVGYLLGARNADGGWGHLNHGASRTRATLTVVRALSAAARFDATSDTALAWLASRQNGDGGFGDSPSTVHDTADVLQVFADRRRRAKSTRGSLPSWSQQSLTALNEHLRDRARLTASRVEGSRTRDSVR
jgi:squalene cyclase